MGARAKITWGTESCEMSNILHSDPTEQMVKHHHHGKEHDPPYRRLTTLLGTSIRIHHTGKVLSSLTSSFTLHFCDMSTRALYTNYRYRYRYSSAKKESPSFSFTSQLHRAYPSQHVEISLIHWNIPDPLSYRPTSIGRHHHMYIKNSPESFCSTRSVC